MHKLLEYTSIHMPVYNKQGWQLSRTEGVSHLGTLSPSPSNPILSPASWTFLLWTVVKQWIPPIRSVYNPLFFLLVTFSWSQNCTIWWEPNRSTNFWFLTPSSSQKLTVLNIPLAYKNQWSESTEAAISRKASGLWNKFCNLVSSYKNYFLHLALTKNCSILIF